MPTIKELEAAGYKDSGSISLDMLKQLGSGAVEGMAGMAGLAADVGSYIPPYVFMPEFNQAKAVAEKQGINTYFPNALAAEQSVEPYLADRPKSLIGDLTRTTGTFLAPTPGAKYKGVKGLASALMDALGASTAYTAADWLYPESAELKFVAPILGGQLRNAVTGVKRITNTGGWGKQGAQREAAKQMISAAGMDKGALETAMAQAPDRIGELEQFRTTGEILGNPGLLALEQAVGKSPDNINSYASNTLARRAVRDRILGNVAPTSSSLEELGTTVKEGAQAEKVNRLALSNALFEAIDPEGSVKLGIDPVTVDAQKLMQENYDSIGRPAPKSLSTLVRALQESELNPVGAGDSLVGDPSRVVRNFNQVQRSRSWALELEREAAAKQYNTEAKIAGNIASKLDDVAAQAAEKGSEFTPDQLKRWRDARDNWRDYQVTFNEGSGAKLLDPRRAAGRIFSDVWDGSAKTAQQIKGIIGKNDGAMEALRSGLVQSLKRDAGGDITLAKFGRFLDKNRNGFKEIFDPETFDKLQYVLQDLKSEAKASEMAKIPSKNNSQTAQFMRAFSWLLGALGSAAVKAASGISDAQVEAVLYQSLMNPSFAKRILNATTESDLEALSTKIIRDAAKTAPKAGAAEAADEY